MPEEPVYFEAGNARRRVGLPSASAASDDEQTSLAERIHKQQDGKRDPERLIDAALMAVAA